MEYGSVVTHENYNEKLNLNEAQGDYNTEVLKLMNTEVDPAKTVHVAYLDKVISDESNRINKILQTHATLIDENKTGIANNKAAIKNNADAINNILNGTSAIAHAATADNITGVETVGAHKYYGTSYTGAVGFHEMPDSLYAKELSEDVVDIDGIYFTPRPDSVTENMLTEVLRNKINSKANINYNMLENRPKINGTLLTGDVSLDAIGAQPKGAYLTSVPEVYATKTDVTNAVAPYLLAKTASATYATKEAVGNLGSTVSALSSLVEQNKTDAEGKYAVNCVGSFTGTPKDGDLLITL